MQNRSLTAGFWILFALGLCLPLACRLKTSDAPLSASEEQGVREAVAGVSLPAEAVSLQEMADVSAIASAINAFGFDLYARLSQKEANMVFSPYSLASALLMTYAGAAGNTADQMAKTLHLTGGETNPHTDFFRLEKSLQVSAATSPCTLQSANALWAQKGSGLLPAYQEQVKQYYSAGIEEKDFVKNAAKTRGQINAWVAGKTKGKIRDLIPEGGLDSLTRLVLTNAIYFQGAWQSPFAPEATKPALFRTAKKEQTEVPMMAQTGRFRYAGTPALQVLELPYEGGQLSMLILLPAKEDGLPEVERMLRPRNLKNWIARLQMRDVQVFLPRFRIASGFAPTDTLAAMGMRDAFSMEADFSGMNGKKDLFIGSVFHKTFADVNEQGTEAAAATAVEMRLKAVLPQEPSAIFRADHPFLFLIRHQASECILFAGRVANPKE